MMQTTVAKRMVKLGSMFGKKKGTLKHNLIPSNPFEMECPTVKPEKRGQAMKIFKAPADSIEEVHGWLDEARTLSELEHPNIVRVYDADAVPGKHGLTGYFTMEYAAGGTLDRRWRSFDVQLMPVTEAVDIIRQVCRALAVAHEMQPPIVHRDIKPANILIHYQPHGIQARLSDFGLAKRVNPMTLLVSCRGTLGFKAPEAFSMSNDSPASDIWAVGTTLYLLLTDRMPFPGLNERDFEKPERFMRPLSPPSRYNSNVDPGLESIIHRCLATRPEDRYSNATELLTDLDRWVPSPDGDRFMLSKSSSTNRPKTVVPAISPHDFKAEAKVALTQALKQAQSQAGLSTAADLLEEAISKDPSLRGAFESQLHWWRRGISYGGVQIPPSVAGGDHLSSTL